MATAILKKNSLWLLPFYMVVATYFYYEKVRRTMRTAIVSNLLKIVCGLCNATDSHYCYRIKIFFIKKPIDQFCFSSQKNMSAP